MDSRLRFRLLCVGLVLAMSALAQAGPVLSVVDEANPAATTLTLDPGTMHTFDVVLSGLDTANGQTLDFLAATVNFDPALIGTPTAIRPGTIADPTGLLLSTFPGEADATFDMFLSSSGTSLITTNGVFFSFDVTVLGTPAGGSTAFNFPFINSNDPNDPTVTTTPDPTPVTLDVPAQASTVPEPATLLPALLAVALVGLRQTRRRSA